MFVDSTSTKVQEHFLKRNMVCQEEKHIYMSIVLLKKKRKKVYVELVAL